MKQNIIILSILVLTGCSKQVDIAGFNEQAWKHDKHGCEGIRYSMIDKLRSIEDELKGLDNDEIISVLGKPEKTTLGKRNLKHFVYAVTPATSCIIDTTRKKIELTIRFNAVGLAYEVIIL